MTFILGNEKLLLKSRFFNVNNCWDYPLEELEHVIETNAEPDMIYVVGEDKRIYETDCTSYELNDLYKELNQTPTLRKFELAALSIAIKVYVRYGMDAAMDKLEKWKENNKDYNPDLNLVKEHFEQIIEPLKKQKLKDFDDMTFKPDNDFGYLNNMVFSICEKDKELSNEFIEQFKEYIEHPKENEQIGITGQVIMEEEKAYIMFVLAYDLLQEEFKNSSEPECDLVFEKCNNMAEDFLKSEFNTNTKGLYDCLADYVQSKRYVDFIMDNEENDNEL